MKCDLKALVFDVQGRGGRDGHTNIMDSGVMDTMHSAQGRSNYGDGSIMDTGTTPWNPVPSCPHSPDRPEEDEAGT
jgi:hypothetical protein